MDRIRSIVRGIGDFIASFFKSPQSGGTYADTHYINPSSPVGDPETIRQYLDHVEGRPRDD
ncbi:MAG TPA: hypothetical protein VFA78_06670 [Chloroflexota bacterium]|nr:hypothetical protein [Chloroflexota bacterium]